MCNLDLHSSGMWHTLLGNGCIIFETPKLSQNTGNQLPIGVAPHPIRETSTAFS